MYIRRPMCVFCLLFVLVLSAVSAAAGLKGPPEHKELDGMFLGFRGTIKQIEHKDDNLILHIKDILLADGTDLKGNVMMYIPFDEQIMKQLHIGSRIEAAGEFNDFKRACNRGQFDLSAYRTLKGDIYAVYKGNVFTATKSFDRITDGLYRIKERTKKVYEHYFDEKEYGVLEALVLADKGRLDRDIKERYSDAGIGHILALSGLHIAGIGFMLMKLMKKVRIPQGPAALLSSTLMLGYCLMIGMPLSAVRALIMFFIAMGAALFKRSVDLRTSAALACLLMLIINPDSLYDASFLMSFSACLGIGLVYPYIRDLVLNALGKARVRMLKRSEKRIVRLGMGILTSLLLSTCIQIAVIPFTMWFYYRIPVYGLLINLIVVPVAGVLLILAIMSGIFGSMAMYVPGFGNPVDITAKGTAYLVHLILKLYDLLTFEVNRMPGAVLVTGRPAVWQIIIYYLILSAAVMYAAYLDHREKLLKGRIRKRIRVRSLDSSVKLPEYLKERARFTITIIIVSFILLFARIKPDFEISALYTGQGQCFIMHGRDVPTIMYDCGSTDEKNLYEYTVEPFLECLKLDCIDTVFISHLDTDHVNGLLQLLSEADPYIKIGRIVISADKSQEQSDNYESLLTLADKRGVPLYRMSAGESLKWKNISIKCLWPRTGAATGTLRPPADIQVAPDINDGSLVLSFEYGRKGSDINGNHNCFRALFTGDISSETEEKIIDVLRIERPDTAGYDYLQVAHHGSAGSANASFIKAVSPKVGIISAGIDNPYGHPHKETLELFNIYRIPVFVTAECGETDIKKYPEGLHVVKYRDIK